MPARFITSKDEFRSFRISFQEKETQVQFQAQSRVPPSVRINRKEVDFPLVFVACEMSHMVHVFNEENGSDLRSDHDQLSSEHHTSKGVTL